MMMKMRMTAMSRNTALNKTANAAAHNGAYTMPQIDVLSNITYARSLQAAAVRKGTIIVARAIARATVWLVQPLLDWQRKNRTYSELMSLDDRMLEDIGLHRTQVRSVAFDSEIEAGVAANTNRSPKAA